MKNNQLLKKKILYRSSHRGSKEMDLLLVNFVKKYINSFDGLQLKDLANLLSIDDETIYNWYFKKMKSDKIPINKVSTMLKEFTLNKHL
jgi:antitoxin CptB